jgi:spore germination protein GerM
MTMRTMPLVTLVLLVTLPGCGDPEPRDTPPAEEQAVQVWFSHGERPVPVERMVRAAPLDGALRSLVAGPTAAEREEGLTSWFSPETQGVIRRVRAEEGFVTVDFRDLPDLIPNASTSAGSHQLLAALDSTVLQFEWVDSVEYRLDGSCDAFWEWLQRGCDVVRRH